MRNFEISGLFCYGRNRDFLCLNFGVSGWTLALGLGFGLGFGLVMPEAARAACVATPDCDSLGYTKTSCPGTGVKCPWDTSKIFCGCGAAYVYSCTGANETGGVGDPCGEKYASCNCATNYVWSNGACVCNSTFQYTCTGSNETGGSGTACGGKYTRCNCAEGSEWSNGACACDNRCLVGNILYSDMTCSACNISGKTPIGVVSYINGNQRIAIQLDNPGGMQWSSYESSCYSAYLSDIPRYTTTGTVLNDFSGKSNTAAYHNYYGSICSSYAPEYCYQYTTAGTFVGGWYLPAAGELYASIRTNKTAVNAGLSKAGGTAIVEGWHWSSSQYDAGHAWNVHTSSDYMNGDFKSSGGYVRCVLAF